MRYAASRNTSGAGLPRATSVALYKRPSNSGSKPVAPSRAHFRVVAARGDAKRHGQRLEHLADTCDRPHLFPQDAIPLGAIAVERVPRRGPARDAATIARQSASRRPRNSSFMRAASRSAPSARMKSPNTAWTMRSLSTTTPSQSKITRSKRAIVCSLRIDENRVTPRATRRADRAAPRARREHAGDETDGDGDHDREHDVERRDPRRHRGQRPVGEPDDRDAEREPADAADRREQHRLAEEELRDARAACADRAQQADLRVRSRTAMVMIVRMPTPPTSSEMPPSAATANVITSEHRAEHVEHLLLRGDREVLAAVARDEDARMPSTTSSTRRVSA